MAYKRKVEKDAHREACGCMNLATDLPKERNPPDLGPKLYISMGRSEEHGVINGGGDAVTRIHCDMADAVNLMLDTSGADDKTEHTGMKIDVSCLVYVINQ